MDCLGYDGILVFPDSFATEGVALRLFQNWFLGFEAPVVDQHVGVSPGAVGQVVDGFGVAGGR
jgi:hypothetical protein